MKGKLLFMLFVIIIAVITYFYVSPTAPVLAIDKIYNVTEAGRTVLVNVTLINVNALGSWMMDLVWDPTMIRLTTGGPNSIQPAAGGPPVELIEGPFMKNAGETRFICNFVDHETGETVVLVVFSNLASSASGSGVILIMNFTVVQAGTTTIEMRPVKPASNQSIVASTSNKLIDHVEVSGLITKEGPPPLWESIDFQNTIIAGEVAVLGTASVVVYLRVHPRPARKRTMLQPTIDPEDQGESG